MVENLLIKEIGFVESMSRITGKSIEERSFFVMHLEETVKLVKKKSIIEVDLPWRYIGESRKRMCIGCLLMHFLRVMPLWLFLLLFQVTCLVLKSPPIMICVKWSNVLNLCKQFGIICFRGGRYTATMINDVGVRSLMAVYSISKCDRGIMQEGILL